MKWQAIWSLCLLVIAGLVVGYPLFPLEIIWFHFLLLYVFPQEEAIAEVNDEAVDGLSQKVEALRAWFSDL